MREPPEGPPDWKDLPPRDAMDDEDVPDDADLPEDDDVTAIDTSPTYEFWSTSLQSSQGEPIQLSVRGNDESALTRRVLSYQVVVNPKNPAANLHLRIHHQRRSSTKAPWKDTLAFNQRRLKAGEEVSLDLHADEVLLLQKHLLNLYEVAKGGIPIGQRQVRVIDAATSAAVFIGSEGHLLKQMIQQYGNEQFFELLTTLAPDLAHAAGLAAVHEEWANALSEFERHVSAQDWDEDRWYPFFEVNDWILGRGLAYQFLKSLQSQPHYGGQGVSGRGLQRGDQLMATEGVARFTVLVEIKRPDTQLLGPKYRNGAYPVSAEVAGSIAQLQANCRIWTVEGSASEANRNIEAETFSPRGILIVGNLAQLRGQEGRMKTASFEEFRQHLMNPELVTFDELLAKARFMVASAAARARGSDHLDPAHRLSKHESGGR